VGKLRFLIILKRRVGITAIISVLLNKDEIERIEKGKAFYCLY